MGQDASTEYHLWSHSSPVSIEMITITKKMQSWSADKHFRYSFNQYMKYHVQVSNKSCKQFLWLFVTFIMVKVFLLVCWQTYEILLVLITWSNPPFSALQQIFLRVCCVHQQFHLDIYVVDLLILPKDQVRTHCHRFRFSLILHCSTNTSWSVF